jgi:hypothetical protein
MAAQAARQRATGEADARIRTADPFITSEVLYQLSYVGGGADSTVSAQLASEAAARRCFGWGCFGWGCFG